MDFSIKNISDLESISSSVKWQYFEKLVAFIFDQNGYETRHNIVLTGKGTKRQFDVIANDGRHLFLIECKKWKSRSERASALRAAVHKHIERCEFYSERYTIQVMPILVTLLDDDIIVHNGVPVVPILKLNSFLQEFDVQPDDLNEK